MKKIALSLIICFMALSIYAQTDKLQMHIWKNGTSKNYIVSTEIDSITFTKETMTTIFSGQLRLPYEVSYRVGAYKSAANCQVEITIQDGEDVTNSTIANAPKLTYTCTTNDNGVFMLNLPIKNVETGFYIVDFKVVPIDGTPFIHYTDTAGNIVEISGKYVLRSNWESGVNINNVAEYFDGFEYSIGLHPLMFVPDNKNNFPINIAKTTTWTPNLAGWVIEEKEFSEMTATAKISGNIMLAKETDFAIGTYDASIQTITLHGNVAPYDKSFVVLTKDDGYFEFEIPIERKGATPEITWEIDLPSSFLYTHYQPQGDTIGFVEIDGEYTYYNRLRNKHAAWNEIGTYYYQFTPYATPRTWHANLAGWYKKEGYDKSATATGKAYFAKETSYAIGEYVAATNEVITIDVAELDIQLQAPVENDGSFSLTIPMKDAYDEYTLTASISNVDVDDFIHDKEHDKPTTLKGTYVVEKPFKSADAAWNEMGTYYYIFQPDETPLSYTKELVGWQKFDARYANTDKEVSGTIMYAKETGFWKGTYEPYANDKVRVSYNLSGQSFAMVVLTNADGQFTCPTYREFGDQEPAVSAVPVKTEVEDFVHYYHVTSPTPMKIAGEYTHYVTLNDNAWNNRGTAYYKFNPDGSFAEWPTNNLYGWYKQKDAEGKITFKLYAQKAIESAESNNHEADWTVAGAGVMATVTLTRGYETKTFDVLVAGQNITLANVPFAQWVKDGDEFNVQIELTHSSNLSGYSEVKDFRHYPDPAENGSKAIVGKYLGVTFNETESASSGVVEIKKAAKLIFSPSGDAPDGWSNYDWYSILEHTIGE